VKEKGFEYAGVLITEGVKNKKKTVKTNEIQEEKGCGTTSRGKVNQSWETKVGNEEIETMRKKRERVQGGKVGQGGQGSNWREQGDDKMRKERRGES